MYRKQDGNQLIFRVDGYLLMMSGDHLIIQTILFKF